MGCVSSTKTPKNSLILHFTGINKYNPPKKCKSTFKLFQSSSIITIQTSLNTSNTILKLKKFIKKIYSIPSKHDLLILYSHHIISNDDRLTLSDFGITNRSLLVLAIKAPVIPKRIISFISETNPYTLSEDDLELENHYNGIYIRPHLMSLNEMQTTDTLDGFEDDTDTDDDTFMSSRRPNSFESIISNRHTTYNSLPNIFEGNESDDETSYSTSSTATFERINRDNSAIKRKIDFAELHGTSNGTIMSTLSTDTEHTTTFSNDKHETILKDSFDSVMGTESPLSVRITNFRQQHRNKAPFERRDKMIHYSTRILPIHEPVSKIPITMPSRPAYNNNYNIHAVSPPTIMDSTSSLSSLSTSSFAQNRKQIPIHHPNAAYSTTNYNTPVPITRVHYHATPTTYVGEDNIFEEHKMTSNDTITATTFDEYKMGSGTSLSPTASTSESKSTDIELMNEFSFNDIDDSDIEDVYEYKASLKPVKGFDIIMQESDVDVYRMPNCKHVMNKESLYDYALNTFTDKNNVCLTCPHAAEEVKCNSNEWSCIHCTFVNDIADNSCEMCGNVKSEIEKKKQFCGAKWSYSLIKQILYSNTIDIEEHQSDVKLLKLELLSARNKIEKYCDVQKCPKCETLYFKDENKKNNSLLYGRKNNKNDFKTKCIYCDRNDNYFCWCCGKLWGNNTHACDTSFRTELITILSKASRKKIGDVDNVPIMRACPNCCQIITHTEACKHMNCKSCKKDFCFVCLKMKKNGNWQCGSSSSPCAVASVQNENTLPDAVLINKKTFTLF